MFFKQIIDFFLEITNSVRCCTIENQCNTVQNNSQQCMCIHYGFTFRACYLNNFPFIVLTNTSSRFISPTQSNNRSNPPEFYIIIMVWGVALRRCMVARH